MRATLLTASESARLRKLAKDRTSVSVVVLLAGRQKLRALNRAFCKQDKTTDVLAFPADPALAKLAGQEEAVALGDLAIGWEPCLASAAAFSLTPRQQLQHLVAHGTLHLLGFNHKTDSQARKMRGLETATLARLGVGDPWQGQDLRGIQAVV